MNVLCALLLLLSPETERLLLGPTPFLRYEGMERALREGDLALLGRASQSPEWDARLWSVLALGPRTPLSMVDDPVAVVRAAAIEALDVSVPESKLFERLGDKDDAVRAAAAWALRHTLSPTKLRPLLKDDAVSVRLAAMVAAKRHRELVRLATGKDFGLAVGALGALGRGGDASSAGTLMRLLERRVKAKRSLYDEEDVNTDRALARAVGEMARRGLVVGGRPVLQRLQKLIARADLGGRAGAVLAEAAAEARDAEAARRLIDGQIRARRRSTLPFTSINSLFRGGMHAFARRPWPQLAPLLMPMLADKDPVVRRAVAESLYGDVARIALRDSDAGVRAIAAAHIGKQKPLLGVLRDPDIEVRIAALRALGAIGDEAAGKAVLALRRDPEPEVRRAVIGAILRLPVPTRSDVLYDFALNDDDPRVRAAAAASISFMGDLTAYPRAISDLRHAKRQVRERAIVLLHAMSTARFGYKPEQPESGAAAWAAWWRSKREKREGGFRYHVEDLRRRGIDLVLVIDATGSMAPLIQATKRRLEWIVQGLRRVVPDLRVRVVFYRDRGDKFLTLSSPLTHDTRLLEDFIACVPAAGGGDIAEAVLDGLRIAIQKTPWRPDAQRIVLLFGDAPPHEDDEPLIETIVGAHKGVVHTVDVSGYGDNQRPRQPLDSFGRIAKWGKGAFVRSGNDRELLREILVLTLGPEHRAAVEALFGL